MFSSNFTTSEIAFISDWKNIIYLTSLKLKYVILLNFKADVTVVFN